MCDGVTQGLPGMELSLFSRDIIAMATAIGLSHNMFDAALYLGVCDKIVPGLLIGALTFGHLPAVFVPAGPMPSGLPNDEKVKTRQLYAEGKIGRDELLAAESKSYHAPGTCTFYGTANSNQMLMEIMGLHLPGSSFVNPGTKMRDALTVEATKRALAITAEGNEFTPVGEMIDERSIVNAVIGLHATGGSTNHTLHLVAIARAAGIRLLWDDIAELSEHVPLIARVYPNGLADINQFHAAGGMGYLMKELLHHGLLHGDAGSIAGGNLEQSLKEPKLDTNGQISWHDIPGKSGNAKILTPADKPYSPNGGLKMLNGNLGKAVMKISAVKPEHHMVEAPARVFDTQEAMIEAFRADNLNLDFVAVLRFQGPRANGMPELHKLIPALGVLQDRGYKIALVTDGRMSGASGKIPAAIHLTPEAVTGGVLARILDGDMVRLDAGKGTLEVLVDEAVLNARPKALHDSLHSNRGMGRELFAAFRANVGPANEGASVL
jgi:phosphogluconate dehydratase